MSKKRRSDRITVYSSEHGRHCPICGKPTGLCRCGAAPGPQAGDGIVRIRREVKGRRGKTVTTVTGIPLAGTALADLAAVLKKKCGTGGAVKDGVLIIQGDHRTTVAEYLQQQGFRVKLAGG